MAGDEFPFGRDYWEDRYGAPGLTWSGNPNPVLVAEASDLPSGRALDIGSGEGGDALWLARQGWQVTGVDIAQNALDKARTRLEELDKARTRLEELDPAAAARVRWEQHDLAEWGPTPRSFDLVTSQFMHLPEPIRSRLFHDLAEAVAPGGTLLIVGHDVSEVDVGEHRGHLDSLMFGVDDVLAALDGSGLRILVAESRRRPGAPDAHGPSAGTSAHDRDVVVKAVRDA